MCLPCRPSKYYTHTITVNDGASHNSHVPHVTGKVHTHIRVCNNQSKYSHYSLSWYGIVLDNFLRWKGFLSMLNAVVLILSILVAFLPICRMVLRMWLLTARIVVSEEAFFLLKLSFLKFEVEENRLRENKAGHNCGSWATVSVKVVQRENGAKFLAPWETS